MLTAINNSKIDISSEESTKKLAEKFTSYLKLGSITYLHGEIGIGKTTFIKYFINSHQKKNNSQLTEVLSPTFNLLNEYQIGNLVIKHYDLYRIKHISEFKNLDLFENNRNSITFIEWPGLIEKKNLLNGINLVFYYENDFNNRFVKITGLT
tara:strand:+ start:71 stop:526 length:456 start_codon:yes stop_codon:yes gene_type:complete